MGEYDPSITVFIIGLFIIGGVTLGLVYLAKSDDARYCQQEGFDVHWYDGFITGAEVVENNSTHMYINCCEYRLILVKDSYKNSLYCKGIKVTK